MPKTKPGAPPNVADFLQALPGDVQPFDPHEKAKSFVMLVYGGPGSGKSSLAASAARVEDLGPLLYLDLENGGAQAIAFHGDVDNTVAIRPHSFRNMVDVLSALDSGGESPFKTVVFDSIDKWQEVVLNHFSVPEKPGAKTNGYEAYAQAYNQFRALVDRFKELGVNLVCITHEEYVEGGFDSAGFFRPSFEGKKSGMRAPAWFDLVCRMVSTSPEDGADGAVKRFLYTDNGFDAVAKNRWASVIPRVFENPTMSDLYEHIKRGVDAAVSGRIPTNEDALDDGAEAVLKDNASESDDENDLY